MKTIVDYATKVKEQHALNKTLAPVETDLTDASRAYAIGEQFIYNGELFKAKTAIAQHDALVLNTNYEAADNLATEIEALTNKLADEVSARAELGAHNWLILDDSLFRGKEADTSYTSLSTGIEITNAASGTYRVCSWWIKNLKPNTDYILSSNVTKVSGTGRMFVRDSDSGTILCDTQNISDSKKVSLSFNTGTSTNLYIALYSSTATAAIGDIKYENLLIRLASDPDDTYQQYAKTNQELTAENQTLTNKLSDEVETRARLGAHNLCSFNDSFTLIRGTDDTNRVKNIYINSVPTLDSYVVSFKVSNASNATKINLQIGNHSSVVTAKSITDLSEGRKTLTFTFSEEVNRLYFYITNSDPSDATITISEVMITSPSDPSTAYVPYAMTNRELTDLTVLKQGSFSNGTMVSTNGMSYYQSGKVVTINGYVTMNGNQTADGTTSNKLGQFNIIDAPPAPIRIPCGIATNAYDKPTEIGYLMLDTDLSLNLRTSSSGTKNVYFSMSYIAP